MSGITRVVLYKHGVGYFERVDVSEQEGTARDQMVINVEVAEKPTGTFQVGAGFKQPIFQGFALINQYEIASLGLDVAQTSRALEMAAGMCITSSQTAANSGASVRNLVTGLTNHNGMLAPILVAAGFTGEPGAMNVVFGNIL